MKKVNIFRFLIAAIVLLNTGCEKDEQSSPIELDLTKTATLKGLMRADLNLTNQVLEFVPQGTTVLFRIEASQFTSLPHFSDNYLIYQTQVQGAGQYEISLPVNEKGIEIVILPGDFEHDQIYEFVDPNTGQTQTGTRRKVFTVVPLTINSLIKDQLKIVDVNYTFDN
jgi:hypothetical protein